MTARRPHSRVLAAALALALAPPALAERPAERRLVDHEVAEVHRWASRLAVGPAQVAAVEEVLRAHDPRRQELLRATLVPAHRMDAAWGLLWNDEETLDAALPVLEERLRALLAHERARLLAAAATLSDTTFVGAATGLEKRARGEPRLPRRHPDQRALATALESAWAAYQLAEPELAAILEAATRQAWDELQPLRRRWREITDRVRSSGGGASEWETHRRRQELEALAGEAEAVLIRARDRAWRELGVSGRQGLAVSVLRNLRRIGAVVSEHHAVAELDLLE